MNSKGHLIISIVKSIIRIVGCLVAANNGNFAFGFYMLMIAEACGISEELVDKRG